jgi:hypothetical protein
VPGAASDCTMKEFRSPGHVCGMESQVGTPGHIVSATAQIQSLLNSINADAGSEANLYTASYNQSTGAFMGYINYPPYASCPP